MADVDVKVQITADGAQVNREAGKVKKDLDGVKDKSDVLQDSLKKFGGILAGAFTVGAITSFLSKVNQAADQLNDLSQRLGASASGLQTLQVAAAQAGGSAEAMANGLSKLQVTIGQGLAGNKQAAEAFQQLGLSARELSGLKTDEAMRRVALALGEVENANVRAQIGTDLLGKGFKENAGFFADAANSLSDVETALTNAGAAISDLDVAKIGVMNDELALQGTIVQNLGTKFLANLSPAVSVATEAFAGMLTNMGGATTAGKTFGVVVTAAVKLIEAGIYSLAGVFETLRSVVAIVLAAITNAVGNLIGVLASAADLAGLGIAERLRSASDAALDLGRSFAGVSATAEQNARKAGAAALQAAQDFLNAQQIFDQAAARAEARAATAAARNAGAQGEASGFGAAAGKAGKAPKLELSRETLRSAEFDPFTDPRVLETMQVNDALAAIEDAHAQTMIGKIEAFEQTRLGSILAYQDMTLAAEQAKNMTLGEMGNELAMMAVQQGGKLGKIGKAYAIAQTVWSTSTAIMKAMAEVPYPANLAAAAMIAARGAAQLANIRKTNLGGNGSIVGAGGGGVPATSTLSDNVGGVQKAAEQQTVGQVVVNGNIFSSQETANWIIEQIREAVSSRDVVFINANSRQAMELA